MEYNAQIRKAIKAEQKAHVMANLGRCFGATALMMLPMILVALLGVGIMAISVSSQMASIDLYDPYTASQSLSNSMMNGYAIIMLLEIAILGPMTMGMMNFFIAMQRGERPGIGMLFHPFSSIRTIWRGIRMVCCTMFRMILWMIGPYILFLVLAVALMFPIMFAEIYGHGAGFGFVIALVVLLLLYIVAIVLCVIRATAYLPGYVLMHDDEKIGAWQATKRAGAVFKGHYKDLLTFYLSFLPWYLLYYGIIIAVSIFMSFATLSSMASAEAQIAVIAVVYLLTFVLGIFFGGFLGAYQTTSFFAVYEYLAPKPEAPVEAPFHPGEVGPAAPQGGLEAPGGTQPETLPKPDAPEDGENRPDGE